VSAELQSDEVYIFVDYFFVTFWGPSPRKDVCPTTHYEGKESLVKKKQKIFRDSSPLKQNVAKEQVLTKPWKECILKFRSRYSKYNFFDSRIRFFN